MTGKNVNLRCLDLQSCIDFSENLKMEAAGSSGALIYAYQTTRCSKAEQQLCDIF